MAERSCMTRSSMKKKMKNMGKNLTPKRKRRLSKSRD